MGESAQVASAAMSAGAGYGIGSEAAVLLSQSSYKMPLGLAGAAVAGYMDFKGKLSSSAQMGVRTVGYGALAYANPFMSLGKNVSGVVGAAAGYFVPPYVMSAINSS